MYSFIRKIFFSLDAESAHGLGMRAIKDAHRTGLLCLIAPRIKSTPRTVMGLTFPNPVGLAAGLDKDGDYIDALGALGFGFIEIGTTTPRPQPGNPKPRLFRLPKAEGIINRMGFNNKGVDYLVSSVKRSGYKGILGINIGKNFDTPIEKAVDDYLICLRKVYPYASYVTVNISSPNTKNLRQLQQSDELENLLATLKAEQKTLAEQHEKYVPLALKIAPDLDTEQVIMIADLLLKHQIDGVVATNTTIGREGVEGLQYADETGGLSGAPVRQKSNLVIKQLSVALQGKIPIIGVGGIMNGLDAAEKIQLGASLVQFYSGLIYRGPELISECATEIDNAAKMRGIRL